MARENYGPDYAAMMAGARLMWDRLSPAMQLGLASAEQYSRTPLRRAQYNLRAPTYQALVVRGLAEDNANRWSRWLTPAGLLVREAGLQARREKAERTEL
jgi:hypothetical protein